MRILPVAMLLTLGCRTLLPLEEHGGLAPIPARVPDVAFVSAGATVDASLMLLKIKPIPRLVADATLAVCVRACKFLGRTVDSGFMFSVGVGLSEFVGFILCRGPCGR